VGKALQVGLQKEKVLNSLNFGHGRIGSVMMGLFREAKKPSRGLATHIDGG
jgi:hypothetical protein